MKNQMFRIFANVGLSIMLAITVAVVSADAGPTTLMSVNVPFDFNVGGQTLRAGTYSVRTLMPGTLHIQSADYKQNATVQIEDKKPGQTPAPAKLGFHRYGNQYFLAQVWTPWQGYAIPTSRAERKLNQDPSKHLAETSAASEFVYVSAQ